MTKSILLKISLATLFFLFAIDSYSQNNNVNDEINDLIEILRRHSRNPDSLRFYGNKLLRFAKANNHDLGMYRAYLAIGQADQRVGDLLKSNANNHRALKLVSVLGIENDIFPIMNNIALNHRRLQNNDSALYYFKLIYNNAPSQDNTILTLNITRDIGYSFFRKQELDSAIWYINKSLVGYNQINNRRAISSTLSVLGEVYYQKQNYLKVIELADSSLTMSEAIKFTQNYGRNYSLLSRTYEKLGDKIKAEKFANLSENYRINNTSPALNRDGFNKKFDKEQNERGIQRIKNLKENNAFYKTNLFKILFLAIGLLFISIYFIRKNRKNKKEVLILREKLKQITKTVYTTDNELIRLKSKAVIDVSKIQYIKSEGHYIEFHMEGKEKPEIDRNSLTKILETLPTNLFVRIHKSYIVNICHIKIINSTKLMLHDGTWINLSRTYKQQLKDILQIK